MYFEKLNSFFKWIGYDMDKFFDRNVQVLHDKKIKSNTFVCNI